MKKRILFHLSYDKAVEAIIFLATKKPGIDMYHIAKVFFYADKEHVNNYGRPILGDSYINMPYGPVPSGVRDILTKNSWMLSPKLVDRIDDTLTIADREDYYKVEAKRDPDLSLFSKSDINALLVALEKYGDLSFDQLYTLSHAEKCYYETEPSEKIDYAIMIDDNNPMREDIISHMREISPYIQV